MREGCPILGHRGISEKDSEAPEERRHGEKDKEKATKAEEGELMHDNSLKAHKEITQDGSRLNRRELILGLFESHFDARYTDREVLVRLFPGSDNLNLVRPRITELIKDDELEECGSLRCPYSMKMVRLVRKANQQQQTTLF